MKKSGSIYMMFCCLIFYYTSLAQDSTLPSVNFGLTNLEAGKSRPPGLYYLQHLQIYQTRLAKDDMGNVVIKAPRSNVTISLHQLLFISRRKFVKGHVGANLLLPFSRTVNAGQKLQSINPNPVGDAAMGLFIQWYYKKIAGLDVSYQTGFNLVIPSGSFKRRYDVNAGAHIYRYLTHFEFTVVPCKRFAISGKNNFYFYSKELGKQDKLGWSYNINYALEYKITKAFTAEVAGFYLTQLAQDTYNGDRHYYQHYYNINDTRERVVGTGFGFGYNTASKVSIELKGMWESGAINRTQGFRGTLVLSFPLNSLKDNPKQ